MEFKVKRSFLYVFLCNVVLVFLVCVSVPFAYNAWVFIVAFVLFFGLFCLYNTTVTFASCRIETNQIVYNAGIFSYKIDISKIQIIGVNRSYSPSLATSFDRIRIVTNDNGNQKFYYISVVDREKFIEIIENKMLQNNKQTLNTKKNNSNSINTKNNAKTKIANKSSKVRKKVTNTTKKTTKKLNNK